MTSVRRALTGGALVLAACSSHDTPPEPIAAPATTIGSPAVSVGALPPADAHTVRATFVSEGPPDAGTEQTVCYAFDAPGLDGKLVGGVTWTPPEGPVRLHHASLFAARDVLTPGVVPCDPMPERVASFGLYTPGAVPLTLPAGTAISLPPGTRSLVVAAHVMRVTDGPAQPTSVDLGLVDTAEHALNWVDVFAQVPELFPHVEQTSVGTCGVGAPLHIVTLWPHMHRLGTSFRSMIVRADGHAETLFEVKKWDYQHQPIYRVDAVLQPGDAIETICTWSNTTDQTVLPGPFSTDEMCNQGLFVWPFENARCAFGQ